MAEKNLTRDVKEPRSQTENAIKVLVVDDLDSVRESLRTILTLEDDILVTGEATNGMEAVEQARNLRPDIVLMDLEMPACENFDGIDACARIKSENLAKAVIILAVHGDIANRNRAQLASCDLFLEKGICSAELIKVIRNLTGKS